jgi:hypothetical protein
MAPARQFGYVRAMSSRRSFLLVLALGLAAAACGENDKKLKVTGLEPTRGDADGGQYVVIKGNRFIADGPRTAKVYFGTQKGGFRQGSIVRFASDDRLIVQAPGGTPGEVADVKVVFEPGGQITIPSAFTFIDKSDSPSVDDLDTNKEKRVEKK